MPTTENGNTLSEAINQAFADILELGEEMREAFEGTPDVFKDNIGRSREAAADDLEAAHEPRLPPALYGDQHHVTWLETRARRKARLNRRERRDNAVNCLRSCLAYISRLPVQDDEEITRLKTDLQIQIDNIDGVFFPGMTGR